MSLRQSHKLIKSFNQLWKETITFGKRILYDTKVAYAEGVLIFILPNACF